MTRPAEPVEMSEDEVARVARALLARGLEIGTCVGNWSPDTVESATFGAAAFTLGLTVVHFGLDWDVDQAACRLAATAPRLMVVRAFHHGMQFPAVLRALAARPMPVPEVVVHGRQPRFESLLPGGWQAFLASGEAVAPASLAHRQAEVARRLSPAAAAAILARPAAEAGRMVSRGTAARLLGRAA